MRRRTASTTGPTGCWASAQAIRAELRAESDRRVQRESDRIARLLAAGAADGDYDPLGLLV